MTTLLIIAHGSKRQASNIAIQKLAKKVAFHLPMHIEDVHVGFLELAKPSMHTAIDACFSRGAEQLMVLPYFLAEGRHVAQDIPLALAAARRKWPNKHLSLLPHIGAMEAMTKLIAQRCIEELINRHPIQAVTDTYQYYEMGTSA